MYSKNISATIFQRFSHSSRFKLSKKVFLMMTKDGDNILDFGTGDGKVFEYYLQEKSLKMFYGYDISSSMLKQVLPELSDKVNFTNDIKDICSRKYNFISCLETMEHIPDAEVSNILNLLFSILNQKGKLLISVPLESGLSSLLKQIVRILSGQKEKETNLLTILLSLFFLTRFVKRDQRYPGHMGFDFFKLKKSIRSSGFKIIKTFYSPFPFLKFFLNSQVFYLVGKETLH